MTWRKKRQRLPHRDCGAAAAAAAAASEESMSLIIVGLAAGILFFLITSHFESSNVHKCKYFKHRRQLLLFGHRPLDLSCVIVV